MKKIFSLLLMGMMLMGMTSCLNEEATNEATFTVSMYNRTINAGAGDESEFFINNSVYHVNYDKGVISVNATVTLAENNNIQFTLEDLKLTSDADREAYRFSCPSATAQGLNITNFNGLIDLKNGLVYVTFNAGSDKTVHATGALPFLFNTTSYKDDEKEGLEYDNYYSQYDFRINKSNMKATLVIFRYISGYEDRDNLNKIAVFEGLDVKFTREGYKITAPSVKSSMSGQANVSDATLTNVEFNIVNQGTHFYGKYDNGSKHVSITGDMFEKKN